MVLHNKAEYHRERGRELARKKQRKSMLFLVTMFLGFLFGAL